MSNFDLFHAVRAGARKSDLSISNVSALGLPAGTRAVHILWMYPDVLNMHGGRGDAMALLHFSNLLNIPCEIRRCNTLLEEIPFDWADFMLFPSGDLACMTDLCQALLPRREAFAAFAAQGKLILAIGSTGALLAERTVFLDGHTAKGLGLLQMELSQRRTVSGDDLWIRLPDGQELVGNEIQLADVKLLPGQEPFGKVIYGRGNCGDTREGARSGSVIFTHCLGPVLTKNPRFAESLLKSCADHAGVPAPKTLAPEEISLELQALEDVKTFIQKKIDGEIH